MESKGVRKMGYKEAIGAVLTYCAEECGCIDLCRGESRECHEATIIRALKKQMPQRPHEGHYEEPGERPYIKYSCPACGTGVQPVTDTEKAYQNRYCHKCGQAMDWSGET